jgi:hypothetical protein
VLVTPDGKTIMTCRARTERQTLVRVKTDHWKQAALQCLHLDFGVSNERSRRMKSLKVIGSLFATTMMMASISQAQSEDVMTIRRELQAIKHSETETRIPALYRVKSIAVASEHSEAKLAGLSLLREPVKSGLDHVRIPAVYAISDIANSTDDVTVERNALEALYEPIKSGQIAPRLVAIDAINIIMSWSRNVNDLLQTALRLLGEPVDSGTDAVRMAAVNSIVSLVEGSGNEAAYQQALQLLRQPINSSRKEIRFMTIDAVERIGVAANSNQTRERAIEVLSAAKRSDWSDALVERAYAAEFRIRGSK